MELKTNISTTEFIFENKVYKVSGVKVGKETGKMYIELEEKK